MGLFTSKDLLRWKHQGSALLPDSDKDLSGVYSGSAIVIEDKMHLFYTGNSKIDGRRRSLQCQAISEDGKTFQKSNSFIITPEEFTEHHRDPKIWSDQNGYHMIVGSQTKNGHGAIAYYQSIDCKEWDYQGIFYTSEDLEQMAECPDYFELDGESLLLVCPQNVIWKVIQIFQVIQPIIWEVLEIMSFILKRKFNQWMMDLISMPLKHF